MAQVALGRKKSPKQWSSVTRRYRSQQLGQSSPLQSHRDREEPTCSSNDLDFLLIFAYHRSDQRKQTDDKLLKGTSDVNVTDVVVHQPWDNEAHEMCIWVFAYAGCQASMAEFPSPCPYRPAYLHRTGLALVCNGLKATRVSYQPAVEFLWTTTRALDARCCIMHLHLLTS